MKATNGCDPNRGNYSDGKTVTVPANQNAKFDFSFDKELSQEEAKDPDNFARVSQYYGP